VVLTSNWGNPLR